MSAPIIVVTGSPRTGSTMTMQMLHAGGCPVVAESLVSFETDRVIGLPDRWEWLEECRGKAVKVLEPFHHPLPRGRGLSYRFIWLVRDVKEQAKSHAKFARWQGLQTYTSREDRRALARGLEKERPRLHRYLSRFPDSELLTIHFEDVLADPLEEAQRIARFVPVDVDPESMAAVVVPRSPACLPYMLEEWIHA